MVKKRGLGNYGKSLIEANLSETLAALDNVNKSVSNLKAVKNVKSKSKYRGVRKKTKTTTRRVEYGGIKYRTTGWDDFDRAMRLIAEDATQNLRGKGRTWAIETLQMMKGLAPLRTENLMQSIKILTNDKAMSSTIANTLETYSTGGDVTYTVGIDETAILPPPNRKRAKHGKRAGEMIDMPDYNYAKDADKVIKRLKSNNYQGYDFLRRWQQAAKENMERIFR